jgi:Fe-Mn family superoxide dismutase
MTFKLPKLPYDYNALEPYIDAKTMKIHHTKHHAGYVDKLNQTLKDHKEFEERSIEEILTDIDKVPQDIRQAVMNTGGGHANHSFFWEIMTPKAEKEPAGKLADAIKSTFGNFEKFKEEFGKKSLNLFGSGWVFLIMTQDKKLHLKRHSFQNSPLMHSNTPILAIDLWEHAYYLKYQNRRAEYVNAWFNIVNWSKAEEIFNKAS